MTNSAFSLNYYDQQSKDSDLPRDEEFEEPRPTVTKSVRLRLMLSFGTYLLLVIGFFTVGAIDAAAQSGNADSFRFLGRQATPDEAFGFAKSRVGSVNSPSSAFSSDVVNHVEGLWAKTHEECLDEEGPNSRTYIKLSKGKNLADGLIFDQYEHHCMIVGRSVSEETISLKLKCYEFWEDFEKKRNSNNESIELKRDGVDRIRIGNKNYMRCHDDTKDKSGDSSVGKRASDEKPRTEQADNTLMPQGEIEAAILSILRVNKTKHARNGSFRNIIKRLMNGDYIHKRHDNKQDYAEEWKILKPLEIYGNSVLAISQEQEGKYIGCCFNNRSEIYMEARGDIGSLKAYSKANGCLVFYDTPRDQESIKDALNRVGVKRESAKFVSLSCGDDEISDAK